MKLLDGERSATRGAAIGPPADDVTFRNDAAEWPTRKRMALILNIWLCPFPTLVFRRCYSSSRTQEGPPVSTDPYGVHYVVENHSGKPISGYAHNAGSATQ
jgi:hypothetical protein